MKYKFLITIIALFFINTTSKAQCNTKNFAFKAGEVITYNAAYNWGFIWVDAGRVSFKVKKDSLNGKELFYFKSYGTSVPKYDWIYKVRDSFESLAEKETLKPIKYGYRVSEVPAFWKKRVFGVSKNKLFNNLRYPKMAFKILFSNQNSYKNHCFSFLITIRISN